jgi:hypothetical protein
MERPVENVLPPHTQHQVRLPGHCWRSLPLFAMPSQGFWEKTLISSIASFTGVDLQVWKVWQHRIGTICSKFDQTSPLI